MEEVDPILVELKNIIRDMTTVYDAKEFLTDSTAQATFQRYLGKLCHTIENIFSSGLKEGSMFRSSYIWDFFENLPKALPGHESEDFINFVKKITKSSIGRGRVFIRWALNQKQLDRFTAALVLQPGLVAAYYKPDALLAVEEQVGVLLPLLEMLGGFALNLVVKDPSLDEEDYWKKSIPEGRKSSNSLSYAVSPGAAPMFRSPVTDRDTIQTLSTQTEKQSREIQDMRNTILELKVSVEKERRERDRLQAQCVQYIDQIDDLKVELQVYKAICQHLPTEVAEHLKTTAATVPKKLNLMDIELGATPLSTSSNDLLRSRTLSESSSGGRAKLPSEDVDDASFDPRADDGSSKPQSPVAALSASRDLMSFDGRPTTPGTPTTVVSPVVPRLDGIEDPVLRERAIIAARGFELLKRARARLQQIKANDEALMRQLAAWQLGPAENEASSQSDANTILT